VVLWYTFGHTHIPRPEDYPVMPTAYIGFHAQAERLLRRHPPLPFPHPCKNFHRERRRPLIVVNSNSAQSSCRTQNPSVFLCGSGSKRSITPWTTVAVRACRVIVPSFAGGLGT
jgi:hypothetical protein